MLSPFGRKGGLVFFFFLFLLTFSFFLYFLQKEQFMYYASVFFMAGTPVNSTQGTYLEAEHEFPWREKNG